MEEIKAPKKERKFLKAIGNITKLLANELVMGIARKFIGKAIDKVGNKRQGLVIAFALVAGISYASIDSIPYPITGNKQRLGFQTTGNGLVYRGRSNDTITKPSSYVDKNVKAYLLLDSVSGTIFVWRQTYWDSILVGGGGGAAFTQPVDSLFFNVNVPTNNVDTAKMRWDSDLATVVLGLNDNVPNELGFKNFWLVKNQTGTTITKGSLVYANGTVGSSGRITVAKFIANGSIDAKYLLGITAHDLTDGEDGYVISFGKIRQVSTDTFAAGAILYPSPTVAGVWTDVEPVAPNIDMPIGFCINSHVNNGTIAIRVASGYKLSELHDVSITSPVENSSLYYKSGLWRDTTAALLTSDTASMLTPYLRDADTVTLSNRINLKLNIADTSAFARDNQISGTSGQVAYFNSSNSVVSDTALRWSAANKSLGINMTTVPSGANLILKNSQEPNTPTTVIATQTFGADTTNWTKGARWTFNGTQAVATAATSNLTYSSPLTLVANRTYLLSVNIIISGGDLSVLLGNSITNLESTITTYLITPTSVSGGLRFLAQSVAFTGTIDNVILQEVTITAPVLIAGQDDNTTTIYNPIRMPNSSTIAIGGGGTITRGTNNVFLGTDAGSLNTSGANNLFIGANSGRYNITGVQNIFIGANSGIRNVNGQDNVFLGNNAGLLNTSGYSNTFIGASAGSNNTVGIDNTYIGLQAGFLANSSGNTLIGNLAGRTGASESTIIGYNAGRFATTNLRNTIIGYQASFNNVSGINNVVVGHSSGFSLRTGTGNVFVGRSSGYNVRQGNNNVFLGLDSGYNPNATDTLIGSNNIGIGNAAADNIAGAAAGNVAIGNAINLPTNNGSNQGVYQNVLFFTGASGTGTTIAAASKAGIKTNAPNRDLEVAGEVRITDLTTDVPTGIIGADADGDLGLITIGSGLTLTAGTLSATGGGGGVTEGEGIDITSSIVNLGAPDTTTSLISSKRYLNIDNDLSYIQINTSRELFDDQSHDQPVLRFINQQSGSATEGAALAFLEKNGTTLLCESYIFNSANGLNFQSSKDVLSFASGNMRFQADSVQMQTIQQLTKVPAMVGINSAGTVKKIVGATNGDVLTWQSGGWVASAGGGGGATDLTFSGTSSPVTLNSSTGTDVTFTAGGINSFSATGTNITITANEVDGSTTNELQTISNTSDATSHTATLSNTGGSIQLVEGSGITLTTTGTGSDAIVTIASTGGGVSDGDKGDITVSGSGTVWNVDNLAIANAKINDVSVSKLTSGTVATGLALTSTNSSSIKLNYNSGATGFQVDDLNSSASMFSEDGTQYVFADNTGVLIGSGTTNLEYIDGVLRYFDSDVTQYVGIQPPATGSLTTSYTLTLPTTDGTPNQVLQTDGTGVLSWATVSGAGGVASDVIWDAKGDLAVGTGADAAAKLSVGSDGQKLYADAAQATGLRWGETIISPAQLTADQDNFAPTNWAKANLVRLDGDNGFRAITSFSSTFDGDRKTLFNKGAYPIYFPAEHPDGTAANRIEYTKDFILFPSHAVDIAYSSSDSRWFFIGEPASPYEGKSLFYAWNYGSITNADWGFIDQVATGTGSAITSTDAASGWPGYVSMSTGTTNTGSVRISISESGVHYSVFGDGHASSECMISVPNLSDATDTYTVLFTLDDVANVATLNNNSVGIRYTHGTNGGRFQGFSRNSAGAEGTVDLGVTVAVTTEYKLRVELDKSRTEARYYIDGVFAGRVDTNMPNAVSFGTRLLILKSAGTTARTLRAHSMNVSVIYP